MNYYLSSLFLLFCFYTLSLKGQEMIIKTNGDSLRVKLMEVGVNTVSYKKSDMTDGPNFIMDKSEISFIRYKNGEVEYFNKNVPTKATSTPSVTSGSGTNTAANSSTNQASSDQKNKIEFKDDKYYINGQKVKKKEVDRYLGRSKNPAIVLGLKGAKAMSTAQKIVKITSYPTTIVGSVTSLVSWAEGYQLVQRGRATGKTFLNMGLNLFGTISLPITNKILTKKSNKMYDKLIDMYNVTN